MTLLIYLHKPQRSGRSIAANTNNSSQDTPPPPKTKLDILPKVSYEIPDIFIEDTTKSQTIKKPQKEILSKTSLFRRFLTKIKSIFGEK